MPTTTLPTIDDLKPKSLAEQQLLLEQKRAFLARHPASKRFLFEPSRLWGLIVANRYIPPSLSEEGSEINEYDDLRLSFANFRTIAYAVLFGDKSASEDDDEAGVVADCATMTDSEKEALFFKHPFLSPKTFLMFERSIDNISANNNNRGGGGNLNASLNGSIGKGMTAPVPETVPAVPLYTYVAKKMLLFRMRIMLELVASVPPPALMPAPSASSAEGSIAPIPPASSSHKHCAPSPSSPLSNGLTQEDVEAFIRQLVPHIRLVRDMPQWLLPYYLCHASRKIMFMLDPRGLGAISIEALMMSDVFSELIRMYESEIRDAVVCFPVGCALEILPSSVIDHTAANAASANHDDAHNTSTASEAAKKASRVPEWVTKAANNGDADFHLRCSVESFENEGNDPTDMYTVTVVCPKEYRNPETGVIEVFTTSVPRDALVWCPSTTDYIPPELSAVTNWFSLPLMYRIYDHFTLLDADSDGVLSLEEFSNYSNGSYTNLAAKRIFEVHVRDAGGRHVMDYKSYLTFVVATEHIATPQGKKYLWDVLDIEHTRDHIRVDALRLFCRELSAKLAATSMMKITADSILSEVVDMINPKWHEWVSREDIDKCKQHHTVMPILLSHRNFYAYDCREQSAAQPSSGEYV